MILLSVTNGNLPIM